MPQNIIEDNLINLSDAKWCPTPPQTQVKPLTITEEDVIPSHQAALFALKNEDIDIRPRYFDKSNNTWSLVDTGAQVSCCPPQAGDVINHDILLETVDGSRMPCYGTKTIDIKIGRKTYH